MVSSTLVFKIPFMYQRVSYLYIQLKLPSSIQIQISWPTFITGISQRHLKLRTFKTLLLIWPPKPSLPLSQPCTDNLMATLSIQLLRPESLDSSLALSQPPQAVHCDNPFLLGLQQYPQIGLPNFYSYHSNQKWSFLNFFFLGQEFIFLEQFIAKLKVQRLPQCHLPPHTQGLPHYQ